MTVAEASLLGFTVAVVVTGVLAFGMDPGLAVRIITVVTFAITGVRYSKKADRES